MLSECVSLKTFHPYPIKQAGLHLLRTVKFYFFTWKYLCCKINMDIKQLEQVLCRIKSGQLSRRNSKHSNCYLQVVLPVDYITVGPKQCSTECRKSNSRKSEISTQAKHSSMKEHKRKRARVPQNHHEVFDLVSRKRRKTQVPKLQKDRKEDITTVDMKPASF